MLDDLADRIAAVRTEHGNDAVGAYLATGLAYDLNGWHTAERFLGLLHTKQRYTPVTIDNAAILRVAELVAGNMQLSTVWDPEDSKLLVVFGTNPVVSHGYGTTLSDPITRFRDFRRAGGELWVLDPVRTETAALADGYLALRPGTDHLVLAWLVRELLREGADDAELAAHTDPDDLALLRDLLESCTLDRVGACGRRRARAARRAARRHPSRGSARILRRHGRGDAPFGARGRVAALGPARDHRLGRSCGRHAREPRLLVPARGSPVPRRAARGFVRRVAAQPTRPAALGRPVPVRGDGRRDRGRQPPRTADPRRQSADRVSRP